MKIKAEKIYPSIFFFIVAVLVFMSAALSNNANNTDTRLTEPAEDARATVTAEYVRENSFETSETDKADETIISAALETKQSEQIILSFAGDCTLGQDEDYVWNTFGAYAENKGYGYFFEEVSGIFAYDDFTFINLEGVLTASGDIQTKEYNFKGPPEYVNILLEGSIEGVTLANNHTLDYGLQGYEDTVSILMANDICHTNFEDYFVVEIKGIKIAYLGYKAWSHEKRSSDLMRETVELLRKNGTDYIIANYHWGDELSYCPNGQQRRMAYEAIDYGVDLVIGHHPHVMQGKEEYKGKTIIYSLGNFCFGGSNKPYDFDTVIFQHVITVLEGEIAGTEDRIIPARVSGRPDLNNYQPVIAEGAEAERILEKYESLPLRQENPDR